MTVLFNGRLNTPSFVCLSTDIGSSTFAGAMPGMTVYISDTNAWQIFKPDLTLEDYFLPPVRLDQEIASSVEISPYYDTQAVTVAGVAEPLSLTDEFFVSATIIPLAGNAGSVYFGNSGVDKTTSQQIIIAKGSAGISIDAPLGYKLNFAKFYIDADNPADGVKFLYFK